MDILETGRALLLVITANSAAWASGRVLPWWAAPLDCGLKLWDGKPLFGSHKTWRGLMAAVLVCAPVAAICGLNWTIGAGFAAAALLGDALSSGIKRRFRWPPGTEIPGLDQIPESLLPAVLFAPSLGLNAGEIAAVVASFTLLDMLITRLRHPS